MSLRYFHGGISGLDAGDVVTPAPPHVVDDNCPICVARRAGRACTVGEYRQWLMQFGQRAVPVLMKLRGEPDHAVIDGPSERAEVYVTTDEGYAAFYAGRSRGDLYEVRPIGALTPSETDHFPSWTCESALVVKVIRRNVTRSRRERRALERRWKKADEVAARRPA